MEMDLRDNESTGSLLNALRYVKYARAFFKAEIGYTLCNGRNESWFVKLDCIKGNVKARRRTWETGKWISLTTNTDLALTERLIWFDHLPEGRGKDGENVYLLMSSTGKWYRPNFVNGTLKLQIENVNEEILPLLCVRQSLLF